MSKKPVSVYLIFCSVTFLILIFANNSASAPQNPHSLPDPGETGPFAVAPPFDYNFGDAQIISPEFPRPVEIRARVMYPADLSKGTPFLIILFLNGRHPVCHDGTHTEPSINEEVRLGSPVTCRGIIPDTTFDRFWRITIFADPPFVGNGSA